MFAAVTSLPEPKPLPNALRTPKTAINRQPKPKEAMLVPRFTNAVLLAGCLIYEYAGDSASG